MRNLKAKLIRRYVKKMNGGLLNRSTYLRLKDSYKRSTRAAKTLMSRMMAATVNS